MGAGIVMSWSAEKTRAERLDFSPSNAAFGDPPGEEALYDLAEFFKVIGDLTRMRIINALFPAEMCVHDLATLLGMHQSAVSHQLRVLKQAGLVRHRKDGKLSYYFLADDHVNKVVEQALRHVRER
jgi:ArsR family transcriptional regulator, lead/cadmium/zinc/bismuth-responsive transcriptional repressor